jgi:hypothetical protein
VAWVDFEAKHRGDELFVKRIVTAFDPKGFDPEKKHDATSGKARIRCPSCKWQPERVSRWYCGPMGPPENFKGGCGHAWNTFDTRGLCPGCSYQWRFTSCLHCEKTAPHDDWYETKTDGKSA